MPSTELDGFVAGLVVCPDVIVPAEWLQVALGGLAAAGGPGDAVAWQECTGLALAHHDAVIRTLRNARDGYRPVLDTGPCPDEVLWELWADGFARAMALRPDAWRPLEHTDGEAARALAGMRALIAIATCAADAELDAAPIAALTEAAPALIPGWVASLHGWRQRQLVRAGRCRCGLNRPYGTCCGLN